MKKRTFYIINLDRNRILVLSVLFIGFILVAYATGLRIGRSADWINQERSGASTRQIPEDGQLGLESTRTDGVAENTADESRPLSDGPAPEEVSREPASPPVDRTGPSHNEDLAAKRNAISDNRAPSRRDRNTASRSDRNRRDSADRRNEEGPARSSARNTVQRSNSAQSRNRSHSQTGTQRETQPPAASRPGANVHTTNTNPANQPAAPANQSGLNRAENSASRVAANPNSRASAQNRQNPRSPVLEIQGERPASMSNVAPAASTPASTASARSFTLQLGFFQSKNAADRMTDSLKKQGFPAFVASSPRGHSVRVGRINNMAELGVLEQRLKSKNYAPSRIPLSGN